METNDELWKGALEDFSFEFLEKFYPDLYPYIDLEHEKPIVFLDKELAKLHGNSEIGQKRVDKLLGVRLRGIAEMRIIYIHVEVQGYYDDAFARRHFIYYYRLFDLYGDNVATLAIFTDSNPNYKPSVFKHDFMGVHVSYEFPIYKIMDENEEKLKQSNNLFDVAVLTAYWAIRQKRGLLTDEDLMRLKLDLMRQLIARKVDKNKIRRLLEFINIYVRFEKPEIAATFEREFDELIKFEENMGISEIIIRQALDKAEIAAQQAAQAAAQAAQQAAQDAEEKLRNERKNTVYNMRKHGFSAERIADIVGYPLEQVNTFFKEIDAEN
jgi:hypothetical protein